jgi:hypothetical protein
LFYFGALLQSKTTTNNPLKIEKYRENKPLGVKQILLSKKRAF